MDSGSVAVAVALLAQLGGLVWGASAISSSVNTLRRAIDSLSETVRHLDSRVHDHEVRVAVLERITEMGGSRGL